MARLMKFKALFGRRRSEGGGQTHDLNPFSHAYHALDPEASPGDPRAVDCSIPGARPKAALRKNMSINMPIAKAGRAVLRPKKARWVAAWAACLTPCVPNIWASLDRTCGHVHGAQICMHVHVVRFAWLDFAMRCEPA